MRFPSRRCSSPTLFLCLPFSLPFESFRSSRQGTNLCNNPPPAARTLFFSLPMVAGYPPSTGGWQPALPVIGAPPAQILNSRPMWVSRLSSGTWSFWTGITYLSSKGSPPLRHANLCTSMEVHRSFRPNRVPKASRECSRKKRSSRPG